MNEPVHELRRRIAQLEQELAEHRRLEAGLRAREERYRALVHNFPNGAVLLFDHDLRYTTADGAGLAEVGLSKEALENKTLWEIFPHELAALLEPHYRAALAGRPGVFEALFAGRVYLVHTLPIRDETGAIVAGMATSQDVTQRKQAEDALRISESRNRALVSAIPDLMLRMSRDGVYLDFHAERKSDVVSPPEALVGARVGMNIRDTGMSPELIDRVLANIRAAVASGQVQTMEYSLASPDGQHDYEARCVSSGPDEVVVIVRDITERKQAEHALRTSETRSQALLNAIPDLMFRLDRDGTYLDFRAEQKDMVVPPESVIGSNIHQIPMPPEVVERIMEKIRAALDTGQMQTLEYPLHTFGGLRDFEARIVACGPAEVVGIVRDITEQVRAQQLLEQRVEERTRELTTLLHVSRHLTSTLQLESVLAQLLDHIHDVIPYGSASIFSLEGDEFQARAYRGPLPHEQVLRMRFPADNPFDQQIISTRQPLFLPDLHGDTQPARDFRREVGPEFATVYADIRSWLRVPLTVKERVIGVLTLYHPEPDHYSAREMELAAAFADQAAVAMENARLFDASQRRAEQFRVISEMGYRITSILAMDELLSQIVRLIRETFGYYHIHIGLIENDRVVFKREAGLWREAGQCAGCEAHRLRVGQEGLSGRVAGSGEPILVQDVSRDSRFIPLTPDQTGSALVLPLKAQGRVIGVLDMESDRLNAFDAGDVTVLQSFANQTAVAIENARLYEQSQQLAALEERQKLARELHDSVSQALYGIALGARTARTLLDRQPDKAAEPLEYVLSLSEAALAEMRALIFELRPESLEVEGLTAALQKQAASLRARHRFDVYTTLAEEPDAPLEVKQALYRIAQEALHNVVKHAQASRVDLLLQQTQDGLTLEVRDDGHGFDATGSFPGHLGLHSMRERAERLGGALVVESRPGEGCRLRVWVPHHEAIG